jgi:hypothetical protein
MAGVYEGLGWWETVTQVSPTQYDNVETNERTQEYFSQDFSQTLNRKRMRAAPGSPRKQVLAAVVGGTHTGCESGYKAYTVDQGFTDHGDKGLDAISISWGGTGTGTSWGGNETLTTSQEPPTEILLPPPPLRIFFFAMSECSVQCGLGVMILVRLHATFCRANFRVRLYLGTR